MFFHSKLFKFLLPLLSYIFFYILWMYNYIAVWYSNLPEETAYVRDKLHFGPSAIAYYSIIGYAFTATFILFLILGIIYLVKTHVQKVVIYLLIGDLVFSAYCVWIYSTAFNNTWRSNSFLLFLNLALFAISIFQLTKPAQSPNADKT